MCSAPNGVLGGSITPPKGCNGKRRDPRRPLNLESWFGVWCPSRANQLVPELRAILKPMWKCDAGAQVSKVTLFGQVSQGSGSRPFARPAAPLTSTPCRRTLGNSQMPYRGWLCASTAEPELQVSKHTKC